MRRINGTRTLGIFLEIANVEAPSVRREDEYKFPILLHSELPFGSKEHCARYTMRNWFTTAAKAVQCLHLSFQGPGGIMIAIPRCSVAKYRRSIYLWIEID